MKIETTEGDVYAEMLVDGTIMITGNMLKVKHAIVNKEHIDWAADFYDTGENIFLYQVYKPLSLLLAEPAGHA